MTYFYLFQHVMVPHMCLYINLNVQNSESVDREIAAIRIYNPKQKILFVFVPVTFRN